MNGIAFTEPLQVLYGIKQNFLQSATHFVRKSIPIEVRRTSLVSKIKSYGLFSPLKKPPFIIDMSVDANAEFLEFRNVDKIKFIGTSSNTIIDTTTGRLGIGTDTPAYAIDVRGTANVTALSGITDFNFQPTSNTASIEYDSNVVT